MSTKNVDTNVFVPPAVRAAAAEAERLMNPNPEPAPKPVTPEVTPAPDPEPEPEPKAEPKAEPKPEEVNWEHRYNSMKGRHDALIKQVGDQATEITNLRQLLSSIKAQAPVTPGVTPPPAAATISAEEMEEYGPELLDIIGRKAQEVAAGLVAQQTAQIDALKAQLSNVGEHIGTTTRSGMLKEMTDKVPTWAALNEDSKFIAWLQLPDAYSGAIRQDMLKAAFEANDASRVIAFFKGFLAEEAATAPAPIETALVPDPESGKVPLEELAAPGRAKTAATAPSVPAEKPSFTTAQIQAFYTDVSTGKYRGKEKEKAKLEQQIYSAQAEGRITA